MFDSEFSVDIPQPITENITEIDSDFNNNIALLVSELSSIADVMSSYISELVSMDITPLDGVLALRESVETILSFASTDEKDPYPTSVKTILENIKENEKAIFVSILLEKLKDKNTPLTEEDFLSTADETASFAYVKNTLADEAYDVITENISYAFVRYATSFSECVRLLLGGEVGFCLLPIEEKGGLRLPTVENLLFTENLKIRRIVPVFGFDGLADLKYALISKTAYIEPYQKEDDRYLEIHIPTKTEKSILSPLLFALDVYAMSLYRIHTVSIERRGESEECFSIVVKSQGESFIPLLTYLTLFYEDHTVVGIYKNLEY